MAKLFAVTFQDQARHITLTEEGTGNVIARIMAPSKAQTAPDLANFERLAACWNAFEGKSLDDIKAFAQRDGGLATADEIAMAQGTHGKTGMVEIDSPAAASRTDDGVWVAAWVFVPDEDRAADDHEAIARAAGWTTGEDEDGTPCFMNERGLHEYSYAEDWTALCAGQGLAPQPDDFAEDDVDPIARKARLL